MAEAKEQKIGIGEVERRDAIQITLDELLKSMQSFTQLLSIPKPNKWALDLSMLYNQQIKPLQKAFEERKAEITKNSGLEELVKDAKENETLNQLAIRKPEACEQIKRYGVEIDSLLKEKITLNFAKLKAKELVDYLEDYNTFQDRLLEKEHTPRDKVYLTGELLIDWLFE